MKQSVQLSLTSLVAVVLAATCAQQVAAWEKNVTRSRAERQKALSSVNPACGNLDDVALKVQVCTRPLMSIIEGTIEKWPRTDEDAQSLCNDFGTSERCIRDTGRRCAKNIQKTIISTLANSVGRTRKRECLKPRLPAIVKLTTCVEKNSVALGKMVAGINGKLQVIEHQMKDSDQKLNGLCCIINDIETEIRNLFTPLCPEESKFLVRLYRSVLEDVIEIVCRNPKCQDPLGGRKWVPSQDLQGLISAILRIIFNLDL